MKRTLPVIITLISISLLGIIYIQFKWIQNAALVKEEQLKENVYIVMDEVGQQLVEQKTTADPLTVPLPGMSVPSGDFYSHFSVIKRFNAFIIKEKLKKAFAARGMGNTNFEFGIIPTPGNPFANSHDLESDNFQSLLRDTVNNLRFRYPLIPPALSMYDAFNADENLVIVFPEYKRFVFRSIGWVIVGAIFFTLTIIAA